jgi:nucleoid DNA-binding protein
MYENPEESFDTFSLTQRLSGLTVASPEFVWKFKEMVKATEELIARSLVDGSQVKHQGFGLYFTEMKSKYKGKQEAIQERVKAEEFKKKLPEVIKASNK